MSLATTQAFPWRRLRELGAALVLLLVAGGAVRAEPADNARAFVRQLSETALALLTAPDAPPEARTESLRRLVLATVEVETIGRFVLGRAWSAANEQERADYARVYEMYVGTVLAQRLGQYGGETLAIGGARPAGPNDFLVESTLQRPNGAPLRVDWRVRPTDAGWRVVDLMVEGLSLAVTQRDEFAAVLRAGGMPALLSTLRQKAAAL